MPNVASLAKGQTAAVDCFTIHMGGVAGWVAVMVDAGMEPLTRLADLGMR
jgi:hypothetical protein